MRGWILVLLLVVVGLAGWAGARALPGWAQDRADKRSYAVGLSGAIEGAPDLVSLGAVVDLAADPSRAAPDLLALADQFDRHSAALRGLRAPASMAVAQAQAAQAGDHAAILAGLLRSAAAGDVAGLALVPALVDDYAAAIERAALAVESALK